MAQATTIRSGIDITQRIRITLQTIQKQSKKKFNKEDSSSKDSKEFLYCLYQMLQRQYLPIHHCLNL
jgi:hypothetical protein